MMVVHDEDVSAPAREAAQGDVARQREHADKLRAAWLPLILALAQIDEVEPVRGLMLWSMMSDVDLARGIVPRVTDPDLRRVVANLPAYYATRFSRASDDPEVLALTVLANAVA